MNTFPQVRHSWTAARHSITRRLIPPGCPQSIDFLDRCDKRIARRGRLRPTPSAGLRPVGVEKLGDPTEGGAVLPVVRRQAVLPLIGVARLPPLPPHDALEPRRLRV